MSKRRERRAPMMAILLALVLSAFLSIAPKASAQTTDFGDAPAPYPTRLINSGARHTFIPNVFLGARVDLEADGQTNATATADDLAGQPDDEDGVTFGTTLIANQSAFIVVVAGTNGLLNAWIDYGQDGVWDAEADWVFRNQALSTGTNALGFFVPATARAGITFARFRFSRAGTTSVTGLAADGEVEDYQVQVSAAVACETSNKGREFWLTFPGNYAPDPANQPKLTLCLVGPVNTTVTVAAPGIGFSTNFTIPSGGLSRVTVPRQAELLSANDIIESKGIRVTANQEVGVYALNRVRTTSDGYLGLPVGVIGRKYIVQSFGNVHSGFPSLNGSQFAIVASEPNTEVTITPSVNTGLRAAGVPYTITLQQGQTYQLRNTNDAPRDLSGTTISASRPVAVFGGHQAAVVPDDEYFFSNHLVEQLLPNERGGTAFVTFPFATRSSNYTLRCYAHQTGTVVRIGGVQVADLQPGQFHEQLVTGPAHITSTKPILVTQFAHSSDYDNVPNADAFMIVVQSIAQFQFNYMFCVPGPLPGIVNPGSDTDQDGMTDLWERQFDLNPNDPSDANLDADGDGFTNRQEFQSGTNPLDRTNTVPHWEFTNYVTMLVHTGDMNVVNFSGTINAVQIGGFVRIPGTEFAGGHFLVGPGSYFVSTDGSGSGFFGIMVYGYSRYDAYGYPGGFFFGDTVPPDVTCLVSNVVVTNSTTNCFAATPNLRQQVFARDNCQSAFFTPGQTPAPGTLLAPGRYTVTISVVDGRGNVGTCDIPLQVLDTRPPQLFCPGNFATNCLSPDGTPIVLNIPAMSPCGTSNYTVQCQPPSGSVFPPGTNRVTCTVEYLPGQTVNCQFDITVRCLSIRRVGNGLRVDRFGGGRLETSTEVTGPWTELTNAPNPFPIILSEPRRFFRARYPAE